MSAPSRLVYFDTPSGRHYATDDYGQVWHVAALADLSRREFTAMGFVGLGKVSAAHEPVFSTPGESDANRRACRALVEGA